MYRILRWIQDEEGNAKSTGDHIEHVLLDLTGNKTELASNSIIPIELSSGGIPANYQRNFGLL